MSWNIFSEEQFKENLELGKHALQELSTIVKKFESILKKLDNHVQFFVSVCCSNFMISLTRTKR